MSYQYDVFISYKRGWRTESWLIQHFLPLFSDCLHNCVYETCGRSADPIFLDISEISAEVRSDKRLDGYRGIEPGAQWQQALVQAIGHSRCLLALWSPSYFYSDWCMKEWESFHVRGANGVGGVCTPITVCDCEDATTLPSTLGTFEHFRFNDTYFVGGALINMAEYVTLQRLCDQLARSIARKLKHVTGFQEWPIRMPPQIAVTAELGIGQFRLGS